MRRTIFVLLAASAASQACAAASDRQSCPVRGHWSFPRKANLPRGAEAALGFPMAELGQPFEVSDAVGPGPLLPFARFIAARQHDCALEIRYEHGGIAHTFETALLHYRDRRWVLVHR